MRFLDEGPNDSALLQEAAEVRRAVTRPWRVMVVCGAPPETAGASAAVPLLGAEVRLVPGPGCPFRIVATDFADRAIAIAGRPDVTFTVLAEALHLRGSESSLEARRAEGADIRVVESPLEAVALSLRLPDRQVVHFAAGFESTAPTTAMAVFEAHRHGLENLSFLVAHALIPTLLEAALAETAPPVDAILVPGQVCAVMGIYEYRLLAKKHRVPIVVAGPEPLDLLRSIRMAVAQLEEGRCQLENQYDRAVRAAGNEYALNMVRGVFEVVEREWRGLGPVPRSGLRLRRPFAPLDATRRFVETPAVPAAARRA